ncbi:thiolase family protein [Calderihabitans maritimus]|uniref:acetyl-CoA C-acetyltransferase n=1 Tax=Calderihabitans maritimus TaxID=1246530 RepID=A0A1Z5HNW8_9FIRM|nr:thiolase family protein [Calderihabitans maritimus]GAW90970.1 acetyl-CoA acetyltransferase [Calderihabitans maritimus]
MVQEVVVVSAARTPFGRYLGSLKDVPVVELGKIAVEAAVERACISPEVIEEVYIGHCFAPEAETPSVVGRQIALKAGIPPEVMAVTVDTACCSSLLATRLAYQSIASGQAEVALAGGVESMSRMAYLVPPVIRWGTRIGHLVIEDFNYGLEYKGYNPVSVDAGEVALEYGVTREDQDRWALQSQKRYAAALAAGKFKDEIVPVKVPRKKGPPLQVERDEQPRPDTTLEKLAQLPTVYGSPTVTAGNAPGLNDGATALVLMSRRKADSLGIKPLGRIKAALGRSTNPRYIASIPGIVIQELLRRTGIDLGEIDLIEINEAFAAMPLVSSLVLAGGDKDKARALHEKINVNGGAIAIGHPVGASGARILMTLLYELGRRGGGKGVAAICGGLAQGEAMLVEV